MNTYRVTIRDAEGKTLDSFRQHVVGGRGMWLALQVSEARLRGMAAGHNPDAATVTVERTCSCGEWPHAEYGDRCPSCPPDSAVVSRLAHDNEANGDTANAAECRAALELQATWRSARAS